MKKSIYPYREMAWSNMLFFVAGGGNDDIALYCVRGG